MLAALSILVIDIDGRTHGVLSTTFVEKLLPRVDGH